MDEQIVTLENRLTKLFDSKQRDILNIYFTAGHPELNATAEIIRHLELSGADLVEVGIPYSDPLADGTTIQASSKVALDNGMTLSILFDQIKQARKASSIPIILMGYFNQVLQFGVEEFLKTAQLAGVDGLIIPDLPMDVYEIKYRSLFEKYNLSISFLITPQTSEKRIKVADKLSSSFVYVVSRSSITGSNSQISEAQLNYFNKIRNLNLDNPSLIGFGIHNHQTYRIACQHSNGAIIGSAFIRELDKGGKLEECIPAFIQKIRNQT